MTKIELKEEKFYVLVGKKLAIYDDKKEAITDLKNELNNDENSTIAIIEYAKSAKDDKQGTFNVIPISWKEIAMGML